MDERADETVDETADDADDRMSTGSFTTVALSSVPSAVLRAGEIGSSLKSGLKTILSQSALERRGRQQQDDEVTLVRPDDSISHAGDRHLDRHSMPSDLPSAEYSTPTLTPDSGLSWVRLKARESLGGEQRGGIKVVRPESAAALLQHATLKAHLLWPGQPGATAAALFDEDDCEVDDENFVLVQPGAVLFASARGTGGGGRPTDPTVRALNPFN